jgi:hypothetical protein
VPLRGKPGVTPTSVPAPIAARRKPLTPQFFQRIAQGGYFGRREVCRTQLNNESYTNNPEVRRNVLERGARNKRRRLSTRLPRALLARRPSIDDIVESVADVSSIDRGVIVGPSRRFPVADARAADAVLFRTVGGLSAVKVGQVLGRYDGTIYDPTRTLKYRTARAVRRVQLVTLAREGLQPVDTPPASALRPIWSSAASGLLYALRGARKSSRIERPAIGNQGGHTARNPEPDRTSLLSDPTCGCCSPWLPHWKSNPAY